MNKRLRIVVDWDLCESNGVCVSKAPSAFELGDDDQMRVLSEYPDAGDLDGVRAAVRGCPKGALSLVEEE